MKSTTYIRYIAIPLMVFAIIAVIIGLCRCTDVRNTPQYAELDYVNAWNDNFRAEIDSLTLTTEWLNIQLGIVANGLENLEIYKVKTDGIGLLLDSLLFVLSDTVRYSIRWDHENVDFYTVYVADLGEHHRFFVTATKDGKESEPSEKVYK